jgi:hypothetical protein
VGEGFGMSAEPGGLKGGEFCGTSRLIDGAKGGAKGGGKNGGAGRSKQKKMMQIIGALFLSFRGATDQRFS